MYAEHQHLSDAWLGHDWSANDSDACWGFGCTEVTSLSCSVFPKMKADSEFAKTTKTCRNPTCCDINLATQESPWHFGASQHVALDGAKGERDQAKKTVSFDLLMFAIKLHTLPNKRMWLCYVPLLFGCFMMTWFLMTCSVFVKKETQEFVLPKLYSCNPGISMQRDASQEDLMWKMTWKKAKRPPVKPFPSPIQVGHSNHSERCKPLRVTVNLWLLMLSYVHDSWHLWCKPLNFIDLWWIGGLARWKV